MIKDLIRLQWKSFFRSASFGKDLALRLIMGFVAAYFTVSFLFLGIVLYPLVGELFPGQDRLSVVNGMVLQVMGADLLVRFFLRTVPTVSVKPMLILPLKRQKLIHYVLLKSLFSVFNLFPLLIALPFSVYVVVKGHYGLHTMMIWSGSIVALVLAVNYADFFLKQRFSSGIAAILPYVALALGIVVLEYTGVFDAGKAFGRFLRSLPATPVFLAGLFLLPVLLYLLNYHMLRKTFYLDRSIGFREAGGSMADMGWVRRFGDMAPFLQLDLKLIWRNKRPRTTVWLSLIFLAYGLVFYTNPAFGSMSAWYVFVGVFTSGAFMINFGQFVPSWDSPYYSVIMAQPVSLYRYLFSKYLLMTFSVVVLCLLSLPYGYFGRDIVLLNIACAFYNIGVNIPVLLFAGAYNKKRIDLDKSVFMNYQGAGAAQFILILPLIVIPVLLLWLFTALVSSEVAVYVIASLGLAGIMARKVILKYLVRLYVGRKYIALDGFREKES
ncbi:DUF5687 family protein [Sinomicrobium soli]|uniref:DUF5687 family protein n=1 Tax=Sinomicrobium sp. N-1-3-6 TaxID=2219864 RepID=UPI000DCD8546|nr:DUF5687 family protein [Sinomicrobium sp. N-1-3-6]RAV29422.1 hypothetical protein DN748_07920 [Sinomicrobium sp. N-1-3-6]